MVKLNIKEYSQSNKIYFTFEDQMSAYRIKYTANIGNTYLGKEKTISAREIYELEYKISMQFIDWADKEDSQREKDNLQREKENNELSAIKKDNRCKQALNDIDNILLHTLSVNDVIDFTLLKDKRLFKEDDPLGSLNAELIKLKTGFYPQEIRLPSKPRNYDYKPKISIIDRLFPNKKKEKERIAIERFQTDYKSWSERCNDMQADFDNKLELYTNKEAELTQYFQDKNEAWNIRKNIFYKKQDEFNTSIDAYESKYNKIDPEAIEMYCEMVLNNSEYPTFFQKKFELMYTAENKLLSVDYTLPSIERFPKVKEVRFLKTKQVEKEIYLSASDINRIYDKAIYDTTLRTIHELFEADTVNAIAVISYNGLVNAIDKSNGQPVNNCIVSILVNREEFEAINLEFVDSKMCFRNLKGISSGKLHTLTPVKPIINISRSDKRFIEAHDVSESISESTNLAEIDWEDFEHLVREIFEKEFSKDGGEVKVTQSSRDGGVDAVAFDPDPIRGGKIVIQAKRYTNTVGVSAVRDLYGTVMNEGATKGILVTTSDFGADSYSFAKDKPITLMNGSNLIYLFQKHGINVRIDIKAVKEAKQNNLMSRTKRLDE